MEEEQERDSTRVFVLAKANLNHSFTEATRPGH